MITHYSIARASSAQKLVDMVNDLCREGWNIAGGAFLEMDVGGKGRHGWAQTLYKESADEETTPPNITIQGFPKHNHPF